MRKQIGQVFFQPNRVRGERLNMMMNDLIEVKGYNLIR